MNRPTDDGRQRIDAYLQRLRTRLRGLNADDVGEIVQELRSHIAEKVTAGDATVADIDAVLAALGRPEDLAGQYITEALMVRAEMTRSPLRILDSLFRWASLSVAGFVVLLASLAGYGFGAALFLCALLKPFHPSTAGLWLLPDGAPSGASDVAVSLRLGFGGVPPGARELLGWWIVPLGLVLGCGLVTLTTRLSLWCTRAYRQARGLRQD